MRPVAPIHFHRLADPPSRVPVVSEPFWIGRDPTSDLCVWDLRVSRRHAKVRRVRGEYMLSSEGTNPLFVNGTKTSLLSLRSGDVLSLTAPDAGDPVRLEFVNLLEKVFVPPDGSVTAIWASRQPEARDAGLLGRYVLGAALDVGGLSAVRRAVDRETSRVVALKVLGPVTPGPEGDRFLRLATALSGATHPSLAPVVEAGIEKTGGRAVRWLAMEIVDGRSAAPRIAEGPQPAVTVTRRLRGLAGALRLLHARGVVHGDVVPDNLLLRADGGATLVDFARAFLAREGVPASVPVVSDPAYVAPEASRVGATALSTASDVYGLAAAGYAMLAGAPPPRSGARALPALSDPALPETVAAAWRRALSEDPAERPTAEEMEEVFGAGSPSAAPAPTRAAP
jgi:pSer/pThr/pTyr-binding forkhead associated (FHA) protein